MTSTPSTAHREPLKWTPESTLWWPAAATGAACFASLLPPDLFDFRVAPALSLAALFGALGATLFSVLFRSRASLWRNAALSGRPLVWLFMTLLLTVWSLFVWLSGSSVVLALTSKGLPSMLAVLESIRPWLSE